MKKTLREYRKEKGLTQSQMAEKLGITVSSYNMYETGQRTVPITKAEKIASILNVKVNKIFLAKKFTTSK